MNNFSLKQRLKNKLNNFMRNYLTNSICIVNGEIMSIKKLHNMGYNEFKLRSLYNMPLKLYKYFPNTCVNSVNYSLQALENNTVYMQSPSLFDDVYDSDINMDFSTYEKIRLLEYCKRCHIETNEKMTPLILGGLLLEHIKKKYEETHNFESIFISEIPNSSKFLSNKSFLYKLNDELIKDRDLGKALGRVIYSDFEDYTKRLRETFRATCFATTPYSQLMWGGYADCHKGFCLEYTVVRDNPAYNKLCLNLFPVIYCKIRPDMTDRLAKIENENISEEGLWDIYFNGALRKSIDWAYQNEWRLLLPLGNHQKNYNVEFFPITKVFLGNRMTKESRKEIIEICNNKNIEYVGMTRKPNVFEMQECPIKCENCERYII